MAIYSFVLRDHERTHNNCSLINVHSVESVLNNQGFGGITNGGTQERSLMIANSVASPSLKKENCKYMKEFTKERSLMNANNVERRLARVVIYGFMKGARRRETL